MTEDEEGYLYPRVDKNQCIGCGRCKTVCPLINGRVDNAEAMQTGYAAYNNDQSVREQSSSGGLFSLFAETILQRGGAVVGAAMSEDSYSVSHIVIRSPEEIQKLRGSKYLQSTVGDVFSEVKKILNEGIPVLFTGTPCQIGGLYSYLGKNYDNLYTQDIICHGVPSPRVWRKYMAFREKKSGGKADNVFFRNKRSGWKKYSLLVNYSDGTEYINDLHNDPFLKGFIRNLYLRPSCTDCRFKTLYRQSDITLADFWGIQNEMPEMDDDRGTSFVWIHSLKGEELFDSVRDRITFRPIDINIPLKYNSAAIKSVPDFKKRKAFFRDMDTMDFDAVVKKYTRRSVVRKIKTLIKKITSR